MDGAGWRALVWRIEDWLSWLPAEAVAAAMLAGAAAIAFLAHRTFVRLVRRFIGPGRPALQSFVTRVYRPARLALMIFAVAFVLPAAPMSSEAAATVGQMLLVAFIALVGWSAVVALSMATDLYVRRFRIDVEDNLLARKHMTQVSVLRRTAVVLIGVVTVSAALMTFDSVRQYGVSLFASAGAAGLVVGLAARPVLSNLIAGVQIAITQPIRIDDAVVVENEWGWIEEIGGSYVVIRLWDLRRLIVPLSYFIEKPFQNWTRNSAEIIGSVMLYVDHTVPVPRVRERLQEIVEQSPLWDRKVVNLQVTDSKPDVVELRALVSARSSPRVWDLRCEVREKLIAFLQADYPGALPKLRAEMREVERAA